MGSITGFVMAVLTITITLTTIAAGAKVDSLGRKNRPNKPKKTGISDTRTKVKDIHLDYPEGSGADVFGGGDEDDSSGDEPGAEMKECYRQQMTAMKRNMPTLYIPQCLENGEFDSRQCHTARNICWCVDSSGTEIPNTRRRDTEKMTCPKTSSKTSSQGQRVTQRAHKANQPTVRPTFSVQRPDDVILVDPKNKFNSESSVDITVVNPEGNEFDAKSKHSTSSVFSKPGVLAVVIGVAVIGLLFSVTLVMFIVYRMRKKDEGSYALDEPKASPTVGYTKTRDREFFA